MTKAQEMLDLARDLRARRIMCDGGNGNVYDIADPECEQAAEIIERLAAQPQSQQEQKDELLAFFLAFFDGWTPGTKLTVTDMDALERGRAKVAAMSSPDSRPDRKCK